MMNDMMTLKPITALGGMAARTERIGALELRENDMLALASLALAKAARVPEPFGLKLPEVAKAVSAGAYGAFWMGPDQWMIEAEGKAGADFAAMVKSEAPDCVVTEQSDGFVAFEIASKSGAAPIDALMRKLVNIDPMKFGPGQVTRTGLEHMTVFLIRRSDAHLTVIGMRSFAGSLWHALAQAAERLKD